MEKHVITYALNYFNITESQLKGMLAGGTYSAVYDYDHYGEERVFRIGPLEFDVETHNEMIDFFTFLQENDAAVPRLIRS